MRRSVNASPPRQSTLSVGTSSGLSESAALGVRHARFARSWVMDAARLLTRSVSDGRHTQPPTKKVQNMSLMAVSKA